jgi:hypothetical protein
MERNWLLRTKENKILGPISKKKLKELIQTNSLNPDDEICSGNGHWFQLKEKEFLKKYIEGDEKQGFNPVSEAKNVLTKVILIPILLVGLALFFGPSPKLMAQDMVKKNACHTTPPWN